MPLSEKLYCIGRWVPQGTAESVSDVDVYLLESLSAGEDLVWLLEKKSYI